MKRSGGLGSRKSASVKQGQVSVLIQSTLLFAGLVGIWGREAGSGVTMAGKLPDDGMDHATLGLEHDPNP